MHPKNIPGMIESVEQELLTELATYANLGADGVVCEFGAYFGRSTVCLANGLLQNNELDLTRRATPVLRTYDIFSCHRSGLLAGYVRQQAKAAGLLDLLGQEGDRIDFLPVFDHFTKELPPGLMMRVATTLADAKHTGDPIVLMHLDAPKWYEEYMQLLLAFGPAVKVGGYVVLQDFFYQWSASVIAAVQLMMESHLLEPMESAATSLLVKVLRPLDHSAMADIDRRFRSEDVPALIDRTVAAFQNFELDRRQVFLPRLLLAGMQHAFESGDFSRSATFLARAGELAGNRTPDLLGDLNDLVRHGFSLRELYRLDISPGPSA